MHFLKTESGQSINTAAIARLFVSAADPREFQREITTVKAELINGNAAILASFARVENTPSAQELVNAQAQRVVDALTHLMILDRIQIDVSEVRAEALETASV